MVSLCESSGALVDVFSFNAAPMIFLLVLVLVDVGVEKGGTSW